MTRLGWLAHFTGVFRWSTETPIHRRVMLASGMGMAGPVLVGGMLGDQASGLAAALGGLMVGGVGAVRGGRIRAEDVLITVAPAVAAGFAAALVAGHGWLTHLIVVCLAGAIAVVGGYSRPAAMATTRFVPFLIIALAVAERAPTKIGLAVLILAGAAWTAVIGLVLAAMARPTGRPRSGVEVRNSGPAPTAAQMFARWRRSLSRLAGWQYPIRLTLCIATSGVLSAIWPDHHLYWVALTAALLIERRIEAFPLRATQRALGTALGVLAAGLLLIGRPPFWGLVSGVFALAGARPLLRARNYFAYSIAMTPLMIVVMDAGQPQGAGVLIDRLVATVIGVALVIGANRVIGRIDDPAKRERT